jgi:hypothetical protein
MALGAKDGFGRDTNTPAPSAGRCVSLTAIILISIMMSQIRAPLKRSSPSLLNASI